jgi:hypothetical protein
VGRCAMSTGSFLSGPDRYLRGPNNCVVVEEGWGSSSYFLE